MAGWRGLAPVQGLVPRGSRGWQGAQLPHCWRPLPAQGHQPAASPVPQERNTGTKFVVRYKGSLGLGRFVTLHLRILEKSLRMTSLWKVLRENNFQPSCLKRRGEPGERESQVKFKGDLQFINLLSTRFRWCTVMLSFGQTTGQFCSQSHIFLDSPWIFTLTFPFFDFPLSWAICPTKVPCPPPTDVSSHHFLSLPLSEPCFSFSRALEWIVYPYLS